LLQEGALEVGAKDMMVVVDAIQGISATTPFGSVPRCYAMADRGKFLIRLSGAEVLRRTGDRIGGFEKGEFERDSAREEVAAQICVPQAADALPLCMRWHSGRASKPR
jgi:hypothetical protein